MMLGAVSWIRVVAIVVAVTASFAAYAAWERGERYREQASTAHDQVQALRANLLRVQASSRQRANDLRAIRRNTRSRVELIEDDDDPCLSCRLPQFAVDQLRGSQAGE